MFNSKLYAYWQIRNYISSQIAFEKDNKNCAMYVTVDDIEDRIKTYQFILDILTNNKDKITK